MEKVNIERQHIPFPSIGQFNQTVKQVRQWAKHNNKPLPTVLFKGSVKLHGTNAAVVIQKDGRMHFQSRERILSYTSDNAGFYAFASQHTELFQKMTEKLRKEAPECSSVQIYGEWCGGNIQAGIGLNKLPKMFVVFALRVSKDADSQDWLDVDALIETEDLHELNSNQIYFTDQFDTYSLEVDFNHPEQAQAKLAELTEQVEKDCPVARWFLHGTEDTLIGEGIVWSARMEDQWLQYKVKGQKHASSKVKVLAAPDLELVGSIDEFVETVVTASRLDQGISWMKEQQMELDTKNTGFFIQWVHRDVLKEEQELVVQSGLTWKQVQGKISQKARDGYFERIE
jgi:hypothetical protein